MTVSGEGDTPAGVLIMGTWRLVLALAAEACQRSRTANRSSTSRTTIRPKAKGSPPPWYIRRRRVGVWLFGGCRIVDAYARRIIGWRTATSMTTTLVLDAIEHAIWTRERQSWDVKDVVHHHDRGAQYMSIAFTECLAEAGIQPSVGAVGSSHDNSLVETINEVFKTELIKPRSPWRTVDQVELATVECELVQPPAALPALRGSPVRRDGSHHPTFNNQPGFPSSCHTKSLRTHRRRIQFYSSGFGRSLTTP
ncbi:DDE-type integrase/transposase/recombinase [Nocardia brasiliensis]|uniref:DDE-type integrase/transposase/recombinase n=1 Tax=Nocardia brasiliensis TaxID=37326 RepID=UPI003CC7CEDE